MDNYTTHSLKDIGRGEYNDFSTLQLSNIIVVDLPLLYYKCGTTFGHGRIASFEVQYKKKLLEWVLSQLDSSTTHEDLRKIMLK
jgi:hypothetical protein